MKTTIHLFGEETHLVRRDVEALKRKISRLTLELEKNSGDQIKIFKGIQKIKMGQKSFQERVKKISEVLKECKSVLASLAS